MNSRPMTFASIAAAMLSLVACEHKTGVDTAAIQDDMKRGAREMVAAYNSGDIDTVVAKFAADASLMPPQSEAANGSEAIRKIWTEGSASLREEGLTVVLGDNDATNASGDVGWLSGTYSYRNASGKDEPGGYHMEVWENRDGKWLIVRMMWTEFQPPQSAAPEATAPGESPPAT